MNLPAGPFDTLIVPLVHEGKTRGFLRVATLPDPDFREDERALLPMVAGDVALELGGTPERGESRPRPEEDGTCCAALRYAL